jgi:xanthine dehydrogenase accessory factor
MIDRRPADSRRAPAMRLDTSLEQLLDRLQSVNEPAVLATIVGTAGSTYRKAGARMLIEADGRLTGLLSGGCFEHDLCEHALRVLKSNCARRLSYDARGDDDLMFGLGAGCEGAMQILLEPADPGSGAVRALRGAAACVARDEPAVVAVVHTGSSSALGSQLIPADCDANESLAAACRTARASGRAQTASWAEGGERREAWIQCLAPAPRVLLFGAGPDAEPVAAFLRRLCWPVVIVDHRPAYANAARFAGYDVRLCPPGNLAQGLRMERFFAAVVMSHHLATDAAGLTALSSTNVPHIELLGPRARRDRLLTMIEAEAARRIRPRLRSPAGLDLGASTPESIALSIVAELHALASGRTDAYSRTAAVIENR